MTYNLKWEFIAARIRGLSAAGRLEAEMFPSDNDMYGTLRVLRRHALDLFIEVRGFANSVDNSADAAKDSIEKFLGKHDSLFNDATMSGLTEKHAAKAEIILLAALESEITYLLRDQREIIRNRTELAFDHLQRSIVVDEEFRTKWQMAFKQGEIHCEKLGAIHLLAHGIWAFKVDAIGGRTDLVYEHPVNVSQVERADAGLVMTEWKKLPASKGSPDALFNSAVSQAKKYAAGVLAGTELTSYRYAVLVSEKEVKLPPDLELAGVIYRHINIAVDPSVPSKSANSMPV